jgi:hypothetical protein
LDACSLPPLSGAVRDTYCADPGAAIAFQLPRSPADQWPYSVYNVYTTNNQRIPCREQLSARLPQARTSYDDVVALGNGKDEFSRNIHVGIPTNGRAAPNNVVWALQAGPRARRVAKKGLPASLSCAATCL